MCLIVYVNDIKWYLRWMRVILRILLYCNGVEEEVEFLKYVGKVFDVLKILNGKGVSWNW